MGVTELTFEERCTRVFKAWDRACTSLNMAKVVLQNPDFISEDNADKMFEDFKEIFNENTVVLWELYGEVAKIMGEKAGVEYDTVPNYGKGSEIK